MHKMFKISAETFAKNCVHATKVNETDNKSVLWIKMIDIQKKLAIKYIYDLVHKEIKGKKIIQEMDKFKSIKGIDQN